MRRTLLTLTLLCSPLAAGDEAMNGRWLLEVVSGSTGRAAWLEIEGAGTGRVRGKAVGLQPGGQMDPIVDARAKNGRLSFEVDRYSGRGEKRELTHTPSTARLAGDELHGVTAFPNDDRKWIGRRAPLIDERDDGSWKPGKPIVLFDGKDLSHWTTLDPAREHEWFVADGVTKNKAHADILVTKDKFWNFDLHAEFRVLPDMNGGIGLRGRYEIQILDDYGVEPDTHSNGTLYSRAIPAVNASKKAGEWQTFDIRLVGRDLTVKLNSVPILEHVTVEGLTAMATDWNEAEPGPITLQGDHGAVEFRRIVLTPLER